MLALGSSPAQRASAGPVRGTLGSGKVQSSSHLGSDVSKAGSCRGGAERCLVSLLSSCGASGMICSKLLSSE